MKRNVQGAFGWAWLATAVGCALFAFVALGPSTAQAQGIASTKHNLGSTGTGENKSSSTDEVCVFCHTPHGADTTDPQSNPPLWNKRLATGATYQTYSTLQTSSLDGNELSVGSVSVACLSCHDGTQAMDNIINAPGSGGYDATGGGEFGLSYAWAGARVTAEGKLQDPVGGVNVALIGQDLKNDHPIGIEYCGGGIDGTGAGATGTDASGTCTDPDFQQPKMALINSVPYFWVDTGAAAGDNVRHRTDMILYTRDFSGVGGAANTPSVECGSCHDPHVAEGDVGPNSVAAGATFLRISNTGSAVCLACHIK
ncbi:MAG: hypothetical protein JSW68_08915 [Burkholderiales bacterium]|nr:MAG: hypothetical protein JSW68_08915 [Burkholderiales bacterium]